MRGYTFLFILLCSTAYSQFKPADIDVLLKPYEQPNSPGVSVGIVQNGKLVYEKYTGQENIEAGKHASKTTIYNLSSDSKRFTAACVVLLAQRGKISLDDKLSEYFPQFPEYAGKITLNHLLNHTSGIKDYLVLAMYKGLKGKNYKSSDVLNWLIVQEPDFAPGSKFSYSNSGYFLLVQIVEKVSGKSIDEFSKKYIFKPLKMANTTYVDNSKDFLKNKAKGYTLVNTDFKIEADYINVIGGAGVYSTVSDITLWINEMKTKKVLGSEFWDIMLNTDRMKTENTEYSKGHWIYKRKGDEVIDHGGDSHGFHSYVTYIPKKDLGIIVLANHDTIDAGYLKWQVIDIYNGDKKAVTTPVANKKPATVNLKDSIMQQYTGRYEMEPGVNIKVAFKDDGLYVTQEWDGGKYPIVPVSTTSFIIIEDPEIVFEFADVAKGKSQKVVVTQDGELYSCKRVEGSAAASDEYKGTYYCKSLDKNFTVYEKDNVLNCEVTPQEIWELTVNEKDVFTTLGGAIAFTRNEMGKIKGFILSHPRAKNFNFEKL